MIYMYHASHIHIFHYRNQLAIPVEENLRMLRPHLSCQTCIPLSGLFDIRQRRQNALWMAQICRQTDVASFTSTGNMPKEVKEAHWRSRINLWTMYMASRRTHSSLWSGVVVWLCGPRYHYPITQKRTQTEGHLSVAYDFTARNWSHWRLPTVKVKQKARCELGSQSLLPLCESYPGKQWLLVEVGSPRLAGLSPR